MSKFGGFLARKPSAAQLPATEFSEPTNPLDLDEELFSTLGSQLGGENEALRHLLQDANHKISELDAVKDAVGKLVEPVGKALRAFEAEKSERGALQTVLNNTRTAYGKLRNEVGDLEKRAVTAENEGNRLRQDLAGAQNAVRALEASKAELAIDIATRRAQVADLEGRLQQEIGDCKNLREENRRLDERLVAADKRIVQLESELNAARQRLALSEDEKRALQGSLDHSVSETARLSRRLAETEANHATALGRLRQVEANFIEVNTERSRLASTLEETNERHDAELTTQRMRFEALSARASASEKLLGEARDHLTARADEIRTFDRRVSELTMARDTLEAKLGQMDTERMQRESEMTELAQSRNTLLERGGALTRAYNAKEAALDRAEQTIVSQNERIATLEAEAIATRQRFEQQFEEMDAALRREKLERSVVEGALEVGRKDCGRLMREVMALQRRQQEAEPQPASLAANAA